MKLLHLALLLAAAALPCSAADAPRPNIVFIMADDHAAHAISAYGSKINQTPNIDRIAKDGMRFSNCFVTNSICAPSRAAILTGKYSHINGVTVFNRFDGSQWNVAKGLKEAGYQTAMIGKWHLVSPPTGFDYWKILPGQGEYHDPVFIEMGKKKKTPGYVTDLTTDAAIQFIDQRDKTKPFFVCVHQKAPHRPWEPDDKHAHLYEGKVPEPETFHDSDNGYPTRSAAAREATMRVDADLKLEDLKMAPPADLTGEALKKWKYQRYMNDYLGCVASVDDNVGRLLDYLDANSLRENTIVVYTSDQGFFLGDHDWFDKRFMYEESLRMPFLIRWPGHITPGSVNDGMILNVDFAPTFLECAGAPIPKEVQGRSIEPLLEGKKPEDWRKIMYYRYYLYSPDHHVQPHYGVRNERYKLIHFNKIDAWELYDLQTDPHELNNSYADPANAEIVTSLKNEMTRLRKEVDDHDQLQDFQTQEDFDGKPRKEAKAGSSE